MNTKSIEERVRTTINEVLRISDDRITADSRFREDLGADSLDLVSLLMALEEEFGDSISDKDALGMTTVGQTVAIIKTLTQNTAKVETNA